MKKRRFAYLMGIGLLNFLLLAGVFKALQHEEFYRTTLGKVSQNYERTGDWNNYEIKRTTKPFRQLSNDDLVTWDAAIYKCISERSYTKEEGCYGNVRGAFFPLFPLLWRATGLTPIGISILNYSMFVASVGLLLLFLYRGAMLNTFILFSILITLPSTVIFLIPYSEALFMAMFMLAAVGVLERKYWIYCIGGFAMAMVRPATVFVLFGFLVAELLVLLVRRDQRSFVKRAIERSAPFVLGYACVMVFQRVTSGSWNSMTDAQAAWAGGLRTINNISDWSAEGFGLSVFSIFMVCMPLVLAGSYAIVCWRNVAIRAYLEKVDQYGAEYLAAVSGIYLLGIFLFTVLTSGGNLHSFFRFTLASPMFYVIVLTMIEHLRSQGNKLVLWSYAIPLVSSFIFLNAVEFGGPRTDFSFFGSYLFMATGFLLVAFNKLTLPTKILVGCLLVLLNTVWNAYLFNAFLSNGWLFT